MGETTCLFQRWSVQRFAASTKPWREMRLILERVRKGIAVEVDLDETYPLGVLVALCACD